MAALFTGSKFSATDADGNPLAAGKVWTYSAGTTTPKATYTTQAGNVANANPVILDSTGRADIWLGSGSYKFVVTDANDVAAPDGTVDNITAPANEVLADFASTSSSSVGTGLVGWLRGLTGTVATTLYKMLNWRDPCVFDWMTSAQIADYQARTAVNDLAAALDLTAPIQAAIYASYAAGQNLYFPPGAAKVTGLEAPTDAELYEDRGDAWRMYGAGAPNSFVRYPRGGTVLVSNTDAPVFRYHQRRAMPTAGGNLRVQHIRFEQRNAAATSPVILWDSMCDNSEFSENGVIQFGLGDGIRIDYHIKGNIERNFVLCGAYFDGLRSAAGVGINVPSQYGAGLLTVRKNTARCFYWGYVHGDGTNDSSGAIFLQNEVSDCVNGIWNRERITAATFIGSYMEGVTGTCVKDEGTMTTIRDGMHYLGFTIGIDASTTSNYGTLIEGNYLETAGPGCTLIKVGSGGPTKTVRSNHLLFSTSGGSVANVIGVEVSGVDARVDIASNAFLPRGAWLGGSGTIKVLNTAGGIIGALPLPSGGDLEIPALLRGAFTYQQAAIALSQADVSGSNVLTLPDANSVLASASAGCVVTALSQSATFTDGVREVSIRTTTANMSFQDSATLELAGGAAFTGPGILTLQVEVIGGTVYGFEKSRVVF